jgi:hypothetical protein
MMNAQIGDENANVTPHYLGDKIKDYILNEQAPFTLENRKLQKYYTP